MTFEFHPLAGIFPMIEGDAYSQLMADVMKHGVREPVWLHEGKIIDGRNRYRAAQAMGKTFETRAYEGNDAVGFVVSLNLHRRHLSESQRAAVAAKLANLPAHRPANNSANLQTSVSQSDAASMLNVSTRSVAAAAKVQSAGVPELSAALDAGEVSVSAAAAVASLPIEQQQEVVAAGPQAVREIAKAARKAAADPARTAEDNAAFRSQFTLPPIQPSASTALAPPTMPHAPVSVTGDFEVDSVLWLQSLVRTGDQALIDRALEAVKRIKTPMKMLEDRYAAHVARSGGHVFQVMLATMNFGDLESLAKAAVKNAAQRHEALSRFGSEDALFADTPAEAACKEALVGMEALKSNHYRFDEAQAAERFSTRPALAPATLADCLFAMDYWDALYGLRSATGDIGDPDSVGQAHDDFCFAAMARIPPRTTDEAVAVLNYLIERDAMDRVEAKDILRNLVNGPRK